MIIACVGDLSHLRGLRIFLAPGIGSSIRERVQLYPESASRKWLFAEVLLLDC